MVARDDALGCADRVGATAGRGVGDGERLVHGDVVRSQLARALAYCHDEAIPGYRLLHRDVKPTNIGVASLSEPGYPHGR